MSASSQCTYPISSVRVSQHSSVHRANSSRDSWIRAQPLRQLRPSPPAGDVSHRDGDGLLLSDQHDQPLAACDTGVQKIPRAEPGTGLVCLEIGRLDDLRPLLGLVGNEFPEFDRRHWHRQGTVLAGTDGMTTMTWGPRQCPRSASVGRLRERRRASVLRSVSH